MKLIYTLITPYWLKKFDDEISIVEQYRYYSNNNLKQIGQNKQWYTNVKFELWRVAI